MSDRPDRRQRSREDYSKEVSTVEKIDSRVVITSPRQWLMVLSLVLVVLFLIVWSFTAKLTERIHAYGVVNGRGAQLLGIDSPVHGTVKRVLVGVGDFVNEGELLLEVLTVDQSKQQDFRIHNLHSPVSAKVTNVITEAGRSVQKKQLLLRLQTPGNDPQGHIYLSIRDQQKIQIAQRSLIHLGGTLADRALEGKVIRVSDVPKHRRKLIEIWGEGLVLPDGDIFYEVVIGLNKPLPPAQPKGYSWLVAGKKKTVITSGMQKKFSITVREYIPISIVIPHLR